MPVVVPASGTTLDMEDRLRALLDADTGVNTLYSGNLRDIPPTQVAETDEVIASIYTADEDYFPETLGTVRTQPRFILEVRVSEPQQNGDAPASRRRCVSVTTALRTAIWKYRTDPTPGQCLWWAIRFLQNPTTSYHREAQNSWISRTQFELRNQKGNP